LQESDAAKPRLAFAMVLLLLAALTVMLARLVLAGLLVAGLMLTRLTRLMLARRLVLTHLMVALLSLILRLVTLQVRFALGVAVGAAGLLLAGWLTLLPALLTVAFGAVAPTLIVAMGKAAHALDHAIIVVGVLPIGLRHDTVAGRRRLASQRLVLVEDLMGIAAHPDIRATTVEYLVPIGRAVRIVGTAMMLLVMLMAAATAATAAATRPLPIVWSH
jgi:hypothetical protein